MLRKSLFVLVAVLVAACGTIPPPAYEQPTQTFEAQERATAFVTATAGALETVVALQPTRAVGDTTAAVATVVPTEAPTLVPPTAIPTESLPTATQPVPTTEPTTDTAAAAPVVDQSLADNDPLSIFIGNADAANGAQLVQGSYMAEDGIEWSCTTCHNFQEDVAGLGPSQLGVGTRAFTRVPGMGPYTYLYNSIRDPQSYIVPGFENAPKPMPHFKTDSLTEPMVYDIIAYLSTLK